MLSFIVFVIIIIIPGNSQRSLTDMIVDLLCNAADYDKKIKLIPTIPQSENSKSHPNIQCRSLNEHLLLPCHRSNI